MNMQMQLIRMIAMIIIIILSCMASQDLGQVLQRRQQECMKELEPCLNYTIGGNTRRRPPDSCCQPLDRVIRSMPECLCSLMTIQGADRAEQAGIDINDAQTLPGRCGQRINPFGCVTGTPDRHSVPNNSNFGSKFPIISSVSQFVAAVVIFIVISQVL